MEEKITSTKVVSVTNRDNGGVTCMLSNGRSISFNKGETKKISLDDLLELNSTDGGALLIKEYLVINDKDAITALELSTEPEYYYTEKEIRKLLQEGTLDQLEDCLNFAPEGVIDLLKDVALEIELPDVRKRKLIAQKTGWNIDSILYVKTALNAESKDESKEDKPIRKSSPVETTSGRKAEPIKAEQKTNAYPEYKVISKN